MFFSGISDEAGKDIATQIRAHDELGWEHLELRMVDGENICALTDAKFDAIHEALAAAGKKVSCFGSAIANWARPITGDPQIDYDDLQRAMPRMRALGTPFIRVMSYPNDTERPVKESGWRKESIRRMKTMAKMAEDGGITLVHENCSGWGGLSAGNSNILLGEVNSPALKVVFDTGNPVTYGQDSWLYYKAVEDDIAYVHIKDAKRENGEDVYTVCGEGEGYVQEIVKDLVEKGYAGGVSIEPHLAAIIHTGQAAASAAQLYESYIEYGLRLMQLVQQAKMESARI
jgi:sugar phosphate isomerase/epimerase